MEKMEISMALANEVLGYLGTRPYQEVFQLIEKFQGAFREAQVANQIPAGVQKLDAESV
jgi:hypothetical protein